MLGEIRVESLAKATCLPTVLIFFLGTFAQLLNFPQWALNLSPMRYLAQIPVEPFALVPVLVLIGIAVVLSAVGLIGLKHRQVVNKG